MISVIIPIYNAEKYLSETFACLQKQSVEEIEVLLVNDGSTDNSAEICKDIVRTDGRFRYLYQENQGVSAARNYGLANCRGEFVTFIDADDQFPSNYLEELHNALVSLNCSMSICDVAIVRDGEAITRFTSPKQLLTQQEALNYLLTRKCINSGPCAKMFRRNILGELNFPSLKAYEDILFVVDSVCKCDIIAATNNTEYLYMQNEESTMNAFVRMPSSDIVVATNKLLQFIVSRRDLDSMCFYITVSHLMQYVIPLLHRSEPKAKAFVTEARTVFIANRRNIMCCSAFPWKEKVLYLLFTYGWLYHKKRLKRI